MPGEYIVMKTSLFILSISSLFFFSFLSPSFAFNYLPSPTPIVCGSFFRLTNIESLEIAHTRGTGKYDLAYQLRDVAGEITSWGHIFDKENRYYDKSDRNGTVLLRTFAHRGFSTQTGDNLLFTYDGGEQKRIYLPVLEGYQDLYIDIDGATYYDQWLVQLAQAALPPSPTPTLTPEGYYTTTTPTPAGYMSVTPIPAPTPSPPYCYGCPIVLPGAITLSAQTSTQDIIYDFTYNCLRQTNLIHNWWTATTDWLEVNPPQGFGFDSQVFEVTVSLGDTSSLSPGTHTAWVTFSDDWPCNMASLQVTYYMPTPSPIPSIITPTPTSTSTPPIITLESGDYNGDRTSDIAIFRDTTGLWAIRDISRLYFGRSGDIPVSGDYDGDGTTDVGIYRGHSGLWAIRDISLLYFGSPTFIPIPGDYNGDGFCDIGLFQEDNGLWAIRDLSRVYFGRDGDIPIPGDYDGDFFDDIAVFRGSSGLWAIKDLSRIYFGTRKDRPAPGDYEGDGTWSPAIFRSTSGLWAIRGVSRAYFGNGLDLPVTANFQGNGMDAIGIFRRSSGLWALKEITRVYYGSGSDLPVTR